MYLHPHSQSASMVKHMAISSQLEGFDRRGGFMGFQFIGVHQVYPIYYLLMIHYCFFRPIKKKCSASQIHYSCMQHHLGSASTLKNPQFTLVATQMEHKEKE